MITVALTGGIGSGKSEVERLLAARGAAWCRRRPAGPRGRRARAPPGLAAVAGRFGPPCGRPTARLDRAALAALVFADRAPPARLEAIVHPLVGRGRSARRRRQRRRSAVVRLQHTAAGRDAARRRYDLVVVVDAPDGRPAGPAGRPRGMHRADARARMAAQAPGSERLALADLVVANDGTLDELAERVDALWAELSARASGRPDVVTSVMSRTAATNTRISTARPVGIIQRALPVADAVPAAAAAGSGPPVPGSLGPVARPYSQHPTGRPDRGPTRVGRPVSGRTVR